MGKTQAAGLPSAVMNHALRGRWRLSGDPWGEKQAKRRAKRPAEMAIINGDRPRGAGGEGSGAEAKGLSTTSSEGGGGGGGELIEEEEEEGTVHIETEGADAGAKNPKYVYKMMLQLQSAGGGSGKPAKTKNNKMAWLGYWSYNKLTDDWAEFMLKNDKPFFWSRVKSYGTGW